MSTYIKHWDCCDSVTETEAWEPEECPFCSNKEIIKLIKKADELAEALVETTGDDMFNDGYKLGIEHYSDVIKSLVK